jgi:hypothetical protein
MTDVPSAALQRIAHGIRYRQVRTLIGQRVTVNALATLPEDIAAGLNLNAPYVGRWNTTNGNPADTAYLFGALGFFDVKYQLATEIGNSPYRSGTTMLDDMGVTVMGDDDQIRALVDEVAADKSYLLLVLRLDADHTQFRAFRDALRQRDPDALETGRNGFPADYFPVTCEITDAAETNAPHLWKYKHDGLWFYTYAYDAPPLR